jgi:flagellar protein FlgJ
MALMELKVGLAASRTVDRGSEESYMPTLHQACQKLESVFISYLLESMRKTVPETGYVSGKGIQTNIYTSMMDEGIARVIAEGPGIGLAAVLYRQLSQNEKA